MSQPLHLLSLTVRITAFVHLFTSNFFEIAPTSGASMLPTINVSQDFCIIDKRCKNGKNIKIGDLLVSRKPTDPTSWVCKRVTGTPGDIIQIDPSHGTLKQLRSWDDTSDLSMQDKLEKENKLEIIEKEYRKKGVDRSDGYIVIPEGHFWVTGDNLADSIDSRTYSVLPMGLVEGKIIGGIYLPTLWWRELKNNFKKISD